MREHDALGLSGVAAGIGKGGDSLLRVPDSVRKFGGRGPQQGGEIVAACALAARGEDATQTGKSREAHVFQQGSVGDEESGTRVFQLIADLALAIGGIEKCGYTPRERGRMIGDGKFPGVREEDRKDFSGSESSGDEATGQGFDEAAIFGESDAAIAGSVNQCCLPSVLAATLEDNVVDEAASRIGVELSAKHWG